MTALCWAVVALGAVLRVGRYLDNRSLWLDESFLAINLLDKSFGDLLGRLDFVQSVPPGFLLVEKAVVSVLGDTEYSLRLLPLLSSLAALLLFHSVARRLLPPPAALLALLLFATNDVLLYQAAEVKPYSSDVTVALALVWLYLRAAESGSPANWRGLVALALAGPVAVWLSFTAAFVLGAIFVALAVRALEERSHRLVVALGAMGAAWLVSFAGMYAVAHGNVNRISAEIFADGASEPAGAGLRNVVHFTWSSFVNPGGFQNGVNGLAVLLFVLGVVALVIRRRLDRLALLLLPLGFNVFATLLDRYPLGGRYSIFLVPFLVLLVAAGVAELVSWSRERAAVASVVALFLLGPALVVALAGLLDPPAREDVKPLLSTVAAGWQPGDTLFVYRNSQYALRYYTECDGCDPSGKDFPWPARLAPPSRSGEQFAPALESVPPSLVIGAQGLRAGRALAVDLDKLPTQGRVWLLFSHVREHDGLSEEGLLLRALDLRGRRLEQMTADGARLYLYRLE